MRYPFNNFGQTAYEAGRFYTLFKLFCHLLAFLSAFVFMISQMITGGFAWAGLVGAPLIVVHSLAVRVFGWMSSIVFFLLFVALTFYMSAFNLKGEAVGRWALANSQTVSNFEYSPQFYIKEYGKNHTGYMQAGEALEGNLREQWHHDPNGGVAVFTDADANKAFDDAWSEFQDWVWHGAKGESKLPTRDYMNKYLSDHYDRYKYKTDTN